MPSASFQQHVQEEDDQSIPGEWDEFEKVHPMHGPKSENKNSIDNPMAIENDGNHLNVPRDVQNQIQESNTQMSFKVIECLCGRWAFPFVLLQTRIEIPSNQLTFGLLLGPAK